jgi:succinate-semialdehyde dehydrogenase/glutarate-semialdehyde dehydrogenase
MDAHIEDARKAGATIQTGGHRIGSQGNFFEPTVITELDRSARAMNEEPFGPLAVINPFSTFEDAVAEANRLPFGLASYAFTRSAKTAQAIAAELEAGMVTINHLGLALPEVPFGGIKDSGYGSEGGSEAIEPYLNIKFVSQAGL